MSAFAVAAIFVIVVITTKSIIIVPNHMRYAVERLGRFRGIVGPGFVMIAPFVDAVSRRFDMNLQQAHVSGKYATGHASEVAIDAVVHYRILDPQKAYTNTVDVTASIMQTIETALAGLAQTQDALTLTNIFTRQALTGDLNRHLSTLGVVVTECQLTVGSR